MKNVGLIKRLIVIAYDGLLLLGVVMVSYALLFLLLQLLPQGFVDSNFGKAIKASYLLLSAIVFYGWFWTHGGQTLGMRVWNLYLVNANGKFISWPVAITRFVCALFSWGAIAAILFYFDVDRWYLTLGLGFVWSLIDKNNLTWHDRLSKTQIVQLPKQ